MHFLTDSILGDCCSPIITQITGQSIPEQTLTFYFETEMCRRMPKLIIILYLT